MKTFMRAFLICLLAFYGNAFAQRDISGTWEGKLEIAPGQEMTVRFVIAKDEDSSYKAALNSPDAGGGRDVPASAMEYDGDKLTIEIDSLSASFSGTLSMDTITGEWKQPGNTLPMVLKAYEKPSTDTIEQLLGEWHGSFTGPDGRSSTNVLRFTNENGRISGTLRPVEQNQEVPIADILFKGNQVGFLIAGQVEYKGILSGGTITGSIKLNRTDVDFNLTKGKYIEPGLDLSAEDIRRLEGQWVGRVETGTGLMINTVWIFERNENGQLTGSTMSPERGNNVAKLINMALDGDRLSFSLQGVEKSFSGKVHDNTITGFSTYRGKDTEVTVTRGAKIEPVIPRIDMPDATMEKLLGRWSGYIGQTQLIFRFERNAKGEGAVFFDLPQRGNEGTLVLDVSFSEGELSMKIPDSEYRGSLNEDKIDGVFKDGDQSIPLLLTKE